MPVNGVHSTMHLVHPNYRACNIILYLLLLIHTVAPALWLYLAGQLKWSNSHKYKVTLLYKVIHTEQLYSTGSEGSAYEIQTSGRSYCRQVHVECTSEC